MKASLLIVLLMATVCCLSSAQAEILTFDDLSYLAYGDAAPVPNGYGGLQWSDFSYINAQGQGNYPVLWQFGTVSPPNVAFSSSVGVISNSSPFYLNSAYLTAPTSQGSSLLVKGYLDGIETINEIVYLHYSTHPIPINFDFYADTVYFQGLPPMYNVGFIMDNLSVTTNVPEISSLALIGFGSFVFMVFAGFRKIQFAAADRRVDHTG